MSEDRAEIEAEKTPKGGRKVRLRTLVDLDKRTTAARAALELRDAISDDLGGRDRLSSMQRAIVDAAATLGAMLQDIAVSYLKGESVDLGNYATLANAQRRLLADLGLERPARDVTPTLAQHLERTYSPAASAAIEVR
jgi:uncharacterized protein YcbX